MKITRELLESLEFRVFTKNDYYGFGGVLSPVPLIAEGIRNGSEFIVIIDGDYAELYTQEYDEGAVDTCENIRELQYKTEKQVRIEAEIEAMEAALAALKAELK